MKEVSRVPLYADLLKSRSFFLGLLNVNLMHLNFVDLTGQNFICGQTNLICDLSMDLIASDI